MPKENPQPDLNLSDLNQDIAGEIAKFLSSRDLVSIAQASRGTHSLFSSALARRVESVKCCKFEMNRQY